MPYSTAAASQWDEFDENRIRPHVRVIAFLSVLDATITAWASAHRR
jgi:hypothetical protein